MIVIILFGVLVRMDVKAERAYMLCVENIEEVCKVLGYDRPRADAVQPDLAIHVSARGGGTWLGRMCTAWASRLLYQHSYISIFFKYDPRLPRGFRFLFVVVILFHTLFITTFFYGYTASVSGITTSETIVLSLITSALNIPFIKGMLWLMEQAGLAEYMARFPAYAHEYIRRRKFETALVSVRTADIERSMNKVKHGAPPSAAIQPSPLKRGSVRNVTTSEQLETNLGVAGGEEGTEMVVLNMIMRWFQCCRRVPSPVRNGLEVAVEVAAYGDAHWEAPSCSVLPTKSFVGFLTACASFGWVGWCLNYLLLFTVRMNESTMTGVATSFGISQATSIFVTQPLTLGVTLCILWLIEKYKRYRAGGGAGAGSKHIGYFADPRFASTSTTLSGAWAYWIFFYAAASVSVRVALTDLTIGYSSTRVATAWLAGDSAVQTGVSARDAAITALYVYLRGLEKPVSARKRHQDAAIAAVLPTACENAQIQVEAGDTEDICGVVEKIAAESKDV